MVSAKRNKNERLRLYMDAGNVSIVYRETTVAGLSGMAMTMGAIGYGWWGWNGPPIVTNFIGVGLLFGSLMAMFRILQYPKEPDKGDSLVFRADAGGLWFVPWESSSADAFGEGAQYEKNSPLRLPWDDIESILVVGKFEIRDRYDRAVDNNMIVLFISPTVECRSQKYRFPNGKLHQSPNRQTPVFYVPYPEGEHHRVAAALESLVDGKADVDRFQKVIFDYGDDLVLVSEGGFGDGKERKKPSFRQGSIPKE